MTVAHSDEAGADRIHQLLTPEGVRLPFVVATVGERLGAFLIDALVIVGAVVVGLVLWSMTRLSLGEGGYAAALLVLIVFLLQNFYFIGCEIGMGGSTLGKRSNHLRVIARDGGPLTTEAVLARNLTRQIELFLPLAILLSGSTLWPELARWQVGLAVLWLFVFAFLPLFNADRLRCGDLIAGTLVVHVPEPVLLADLACAVPAAAQTEAPAYAFTHQQLEIYGIRELQVLEDLLRGEAAGTLDPYVLEDVAAKIQHKIGWPAAVPRTAARPFLQAFYRAQRGRLEHKLLLGKRQEHKR